MQAVFPKEGSMRHGQHVSTKSLIAFGVGLGAMFAVRKARRRQVSERVAAAFADVREASTLDLPRRNTPIMQRTSRPKKKLALIAVVAAACIAVGIAWAAWTVGGTGSGYAKAGSASSLTLGDATASTTADLYPGATGAVKVSISNPNSFPVRVTSVTGNGTITSDKGAACNASTGVSFSAQSSLTLDLAAGATSTFTLGGAVTMNNTSDNSCQGAVFSIPVAVSGTSNA
jgi:hypothetical protein